MNRYFIWLMVPVLALPAIAIAETQGTPVSLNPNEYSGHPPGTGAPPNYTAPDSSEFGTLPQGPGVTFTQWSRGSGIAAASAGDGYSAKGFKELNFEAAVSAHDYFQCGIKVAPGSQLSLTEVSWLMKRSVSGPQHVQWQYARLSEELNFQNLGPEIALAANDHKHLHNLSAMFVIAGGTDGDSIVIRIVAWGGSHESGTLRIVNGTSFNGVALPLTLLSFEARAEQGQTILSWQTADEKSVAGFEVEQSRDGVGFQKVAFLPAKNLPQNHYQYRCDAASGKVFYRLKMMDLDGTFRYSPVRGVSGNLPAAIILYPIPAIDELTVSGVTKGAAFSVTDMQGKSLIQAHNYQEQLLKLDLRALPAGRYVLRLQGPPGGSFPFLKN